MRERGGLEVRNGSASWLTQLVRVLRGAGRAQSSSGVSVASFSPVHLQLALGLRERERERETWRVACHTLARPLHLHPRPVGSLTWDVPLRLSRRSIGVSWSWCDVVAVLFGVLPGRVLSAAATSLPSLLPDIVRHPGASLAGYPFQLACDSPS